MKYKWKRTPAERSVIFTGAVAGEGLDDINAKLGSMGSRPLPETSFAEINRIYVPYFKGDPTRLPAAIDHPPTRVQVRAAL